MNLKGDEIKIVAEAIALLERAKKIQTVDDLIALVRDGASVFEQLISTSPDFHKLQELIADNKKENPNA